MYCAHRVYCLFWPVRLIQEYLYSGGHRSLCPLGVAENRFSSQVARAPFLPSLYANRFTVPTKVSARSDLESGRLADKTLTRAAN